MHTSHNGPDPDRLLNELYLMTCDGVKLSGFALSLEQIVSEGMRALGSGFNLYVRPADCIFRVFYGSGCYVDSDNQLVVPEKKGMSYSIPVYSENNSLTYCSFGIGY